MQYMHGFELNLLLLFAESGNSICKILAHSKLFTEENPSISRKIWFEYERKYNILPIFYSPFFEYEDYCLSDVELG